MKRVVMGALGAGASGALVLALLFRHEHQVQRGHVDTAPLLAALSAAKQPQAASASVKQGCEADDVCHCAEIAARAALDADLHALATTFLAAAPPNCPRATTLLAESAEALARAGAQNAQQAGEAALKADAVSPYAELALAHIQYDKNQMKLCSEHAARALKNGRGAEAERLLGRSSLALGQFKEAEAHFEGVLLANPNDAEAAFSAAFCNDKLGNYLEAREGFLQTLRIDPQHEMARFYLVVLTHRAGADAEARHHLEKLAELEPTDSPKLAELERMLGGGAGDGGAPAGSVSHADGKLILQGKH